MQIGNIELSSPVILAPLSGVTDLPFRKLVKKFGVGLVVSEMVASRAMILETRQSMQKCAIDASDATTSCVQLAGCEPEVIAEAAKMNQDMGAKIIDLNFGCPVKKVVNGFAGSSLMRDEILSAKIFESVVKAVSIPVTLKMRLGWDESSLNAVTLAKLAENAGIKMITIHGRTRSQFFSGKANWKSVAAVKAAVSIPVIVNGDINSIEAAGQALSESGADGVMIGRGSYGRPWFPAQVAHYLAHKTPLPTPSIIEQYNLVVEHYEEMLSYYGIDIGLQLARKHLGWYSNGLPNSSEFRGKINCSNDPKEVLLTLSEFYAQQF